MAVHMKVIAMIAVSVVCCFGVWLSVHEHMGYEQSCSFSFRVLGFRL